jgi:hypothetical protein
MSITKKEIEEALVNSGYLLEDRVNKVLNRSDWTTIPNSRFKDLRTNVEREIDILGLKNITKESFPHNIIYSSLIIECMNNSEPVAFFENLKKTRSIIAGLNFGGFNNSFREILSISQDQINDKSKFIHSSQYCSFQQVAKLKKERNNGWIATHPDSKHNSIDSIFQHIKFHQNHMSETRNSKRSIIGFYYRGLIILQGELLTIKQHDNIEINSVDHVKYQIAKTDNEGRFFTIDVITEKFLPKYLELIEREDLGIAKVFMEKREWLIDSDDSHNHNF